MVRDRIGNSLKKAKKINLSRGNVRFRDAVDDQHDPTDLYRVKLGSRSRLKVRISRQQQTGNADVEIYGLKNKKRAVLSQIGRRAFDDLKRRDVRSHLERVGRSRRKGRSNEKLNVTLDSGLYFIRVFSKSGETRYRLKAVAKPDQLPPPVPQPRSPSQPPTVVSPSISPSLAPVPASPPRSVKPLIQLSSPNGGESFTTGEAIAITWTGTLTAPIQIDLFANGNQMQSITVQTASDGEFQWTIPVTLPSRTDYQIRISQGSNAAIFDDSDAGFSIQHQIPFPPKPDPTQSFNIQLDYRFDTRGWFTAERKAVLESAAKFWEDIIQDEFESVPAGTRLYVENPEKEGVFEELAIATDIDDVIIFAGSRNGDSLAEGGPSALYFPGDSLDQRFNGDDFEPWSGFITFERDEDWFFDATPATADDLPPDQPDFLSVAIHEIGHVLGYGTSKAFDKWVSGTSFLGPASKAENGGNPVPLDADQSHIRDGYEFQTSGELVFDPILANGDRTLPTRLDVAALQDIGYAVDYSKTFEN